MNTKLLCIAILAVFTLSLTARGEEATPSTPAAPAPAALTPDQAKAMKNDLRLIDSCIDQFAIENKVTEGAPVTVPQLIQYLKPGTILYKALTDPNGPKDRLGNAMGPFVVDQLPAVPAATVKAFADIMPETFWSPFPIAK